MNRFSVSALTALTAFLTLLLASPARAADPTALELACQKEFFGIKLQLSAELEESRPEDHIERFRLSGVIDYTDQRGGDLEFTRMPVHGTFDNSRGVTRIWIRPNVPLMFGTFYSISITRFADGHQLFNIESYGAKGPNFGGSGRDCSIVVR